MAGSEELSIIVRMRDFATRQFNALGGTIGKWAQAGMQKVGQFAKNLLSFHGILGMIGSAWGAMRLVDHIAQVEDIGLAFESLTKKVGGAQAILDVLRRATRGTVSDFKLMETANRAILLGVGENAEQFETFATLARRLGRAVGRDTVDAFNDLTLGIGRQSRMILDNLGLIVKVEEANEEYAKQLGITTSELTEAQKKQAFMNATMEAARKKVAELGEDTWTMSDAWGAFKATLGNLGNDILRQTLPILTDLFTKLHEGLTGNRPALMTFAADVVEAFSKIAAAAEPVYNMTIGLMAKAAGQAKTLGDNLVAFFEAVRDPKLFWEWAKDGKRSLAEIANASEKSTNIVSSRLHDLAENIRKEGARIDVETAKIIEFIGPKRFSFEPFDPTGRRADALRAEIEEHNKLYDVMERVRDLRAQFDFAPPLIEPPKATAVYKHREQFAWMEKAYAKMEETDFAAGAAKGFSELQQRAGEWGKTTYDWVMNISGAIGSNLADAIVEIGFNFKEAGKIAKEFGIQLLKDLARITMQLAMMQAVQAGLGAIGGALFPGTQMMPFRLRQHGGYIPQRELAVVGEAGPELVQLPGGSRVYPNEALGGTVNVTIHNHNPQFRTPEQERRFTREQQEQILAVVAQGKRSSVGFCEALS